MTDTEAIVAYYDRTRFDYRVFWHPRAVHFGFYDARARRHAEALENMNRVMADLAAVQPGDAVLDAGCGAGSACFWLARHRAARVTGVNLVEKQLADARRFAAKHGVAGVSFLNADYCRVPLASESFDVVWACESVCHAAQKREFYREACRLLKPGGRLVIAEYLRSTRPLSLRGEALLAAWLRPWAIGDLDTAEEHRAHALAAGFASFDLQDVTPNVRVSLRNLYTLSRRWLPLGRLFHRLKWVSAARLANAQGSAAQYEALLEGAWTYGLGLGVKTFPSPPSDPAPGSPEN